MTEGFYVHIAADVWLGKGKPAPTLLASYFTLKLLTEYEESLLSLFIRTPSLEQVKIIEEDTRKQSGCNAFFQHRVGRIGAAINKQACQTNPAQPSHSLIKTICFPTFFDLAMLLQNMVASMKNKL